MFFGSSVPRSTGTLPDLRPVVRFARKYLDLQVEGLERVPRTGRTVIVANHGGWLAFDGLMVAALIYDRYGPDRFPVGFVEDILLRLPVLGPFTKRLGAIGVSDFHRYEELAKQHEVFGMFPEGTEGNCKPLSEAYRLQEFRRGFVRLALGLRARVVPVTILGGDETFPVFYKWRMPKALIGSIVPVPMSFLPIPVKWKVIFHEPLDFSQYDPSLVADSDFCHARADDVRRIIQRQLDLEVLDRGSYPIALHGSRVGQWLRRAAEVAPHGVGSSPSMAHQTRSHGRAADGQGAPSSPRPRSAVRASGFDPTRSGSASERATSGGIATELERGTGSGAGLEPLSARDRTGIARGFPGSDRLGVPGGTRGISELTFHP